MFCPGLAVNFFAVANPFGTIIYDATRGGRLWLSERVSDGYCTSAALNALAGARRARPQWSCVHNSGLERRNMASSLSQGLATLGNLGNVCTAVSRAAEEVEEE